jgi:HAD superfamily hydrolase (TIGR01509 family)
MIFSAVIFDLDGVISNTASLHARAWKLVFDLMLKKFDKIELGSRNYRPFDTEYDYRELVDGKSRLEGIRSFLTDRQILLLEGSGSDICFDTVNGLSNVKNVFFQNLLEMVDDVIYSDSLRLINLLYQNSTSIGVASSSKNCKLILNKSGLYEKFNYVIGGENLESYSLRSKPSSDIYKHVIEKLGVSADRCIVIEDAVSGIKAAAEANVGLVIGLERNSARRLTDYGADLTVNSLDQLELKFYENGHIECSIKKN